MKKLFTLSFVLVLALTLTACGTQVTGLALSLPESLEQGKSAVTALNAQYDKPDATNEDKAKALSGLSLVWTTSDESVAAVDTQGKVTAVAGGTATITAKAGALSAASEITVLVPLTGIDAVKTLELVKNKTDSGKLGAKPVPENASVAGKPTYASSDETVATVDASGTVTAVANGEAVITTTLDGKTAQTKVTVTTKATGIALDSAAGWIYVGGGHTLKPSTLPAEAPASTYTYTSANTSVATVNDNGVITGKSVGSAKITVKSADGFATEYTITVNAKPAPPKPKPSAKPNTVTGGSVAASGGAAAGGGDAGGGVVAPDPAPTPEPAPAPPPADVVAGLPVTPVPPDDLDGGF